MSSITAKHWKHVMVARHLAIETLCVFSGTTGKSCNMRDLNMNISSLSIDKIYCRPFAALIKALILSKSW